MSNIYRALCAELLQAVDTLLGQGESPVNPGVRLILTVHLEDLEDCADRTRAALAQPEPVAPTDEELEATARAAEIQYMKKHGGLTASTTDGLHAQLQAQRLAGLRAVLALYARPTP